MNDIQNIRRYHMITKANIIEDGHGNLVRFPDEYRFNCKAVLVNRIGDIVLLVP